MKVKIHNFEIGPEGLPTPELDSKPNRPNRPIRPRMSMIKDRIISVTSLFINRK